MVNHLWFLEIKEKELILEYGQHFKKTQKKVYYSENDKIIYRFRYIKNQKGELFSPLWLYLGIEKNQKMSIDFKFK